jgi:hypothetical protein
MNFHANTKDLGNGFRDHGVATPISNHRGTVATVDGEGRPIVLVWLFDIRGANTLLVIDATTGETTEMDVPFPPGGDCPYASLLSSRNRYYTHYNSYFVEFDAESLAFTFHQKTTPQMTMGLTEDDQGIIWSVTYPQSGVVSYNPVSGEFKDYGHVYEQNWRQYPTTLAADETGWLYFGVGTTSSQIISFDRQTGQAKPLLTEEERVSGTGYVYRDQDGKVYGLKSTAGPFVDATGEEDEWFSLYEGERTHVGRIQMQRKRILTGAQGYFHAEFPSGDRIHQCDLVDRKLIIQSTDGTLRELAFDYASEGARIESLAVAPDNTICGGTCFPMRFFSYNSTSDEWINRQSYGQWNTVDRQDERFYVGGYGSGYLLEWNPAQEWIPTEKGETGCNPHYVTECTPDIYRPHCLLAHSDGKTIIMGGTPQYGHTGGGLLICDREAGTASLLEHTEIVQNHSTMSLAPLPGGKLLGGTTTQAASGGEQKAMLAELYILDIATKQVEWHEALLADAEAITDLCVLSNGNICGFADKKLFFVFNPQTREIVHRENVEPNIGQTISQQGPRVFCTGPNGDIYALFARGIAAIEQDTYDIRIIAESPVQITSGGDILDDHIYFASGSRLYSCLLSQ